MPTKIIIKSSSFSSVVRRLVSVVIPRWAGVWHLASGVNLLWCLSSVVCFLSSSAWAGDLTTDNLTVTKDATIMGNMYFSTTVGGTNGSGATATGGTITTNGNYCIHTFTNVGTADVEWGLECRIATQNSQFSEAGTANESVSHIVSTFGCFRRKVSR